MDADAYLNRWRHRWTQRWPSEGQKAEGVVSVCVGWYESVGLWVKDECTDREGVYMPGWLHTRRTAYVTVQVRGWVLV